jgi:hypothetical protein
MRRFSQYPASLAHRCNVLPRRILLYRDSDDEKRRYRPNHSKSVAFSLNKWFCSLRSAAAIRRKQDSWGISLQGFDRDTDKLVARFTIPKSSEHTVKVIAGILPSHDGLGDYPLDQKQIAQIALVLRDTQCSAGTSYLLVGIPTGSATGQPSEEVSLMS